MKRILKRTAAWAIGLLLIAALVFALRPAPAPPDFAPVMRGPLRVTIDEEGETRVRDRFIHFGAFERACPADRTGAGRLGQGEKKRPWLRFCPSSRNCSTCERGPVPKRGSKLRKLLSVIRRPGGSRPARSWRSRGRSLKDTSGSPSKRSSRRNSLRRLGLRNAPRKRCWKRLSFAVQNAEYELEVVKTSLLQTEQDASGPVEGAGNQAPILIRSPVDGVVLRVLRESQAVVPAGEPLVEVETRLTWKSLRTCSPRTPSKSSRETSC